MLETPHALVGAAIASKIPNPLISVPLAFASHFVLDMVPHWNPHLNTETKKYGGVTKSTTLFIAADVLLALVSGTIIATNYSENPFHMMTIFMGAFAGVLPDAIEAPYFFFHYKTKAIEKWLSFQKSIQVDTSLVPGLLTQFSTIVAALWWIAN